MCSWRLSLEHSFRVRCGVGLAIAEEPVRLGLALLRGQKARAISPICSINCSYANPKWQDFAPHTLKPFNAGELPENGSGAHRHRCLRHDLSDFQGLKRRKGSIAGNNFVVD